VFAAHLTDNIPVKKDALQPTHPRDQNHGRILVAEHPVRVLHVALPASPRPRRDLSLVIATACQSSLQAVRRVGANLAAPASSPKEGRIQGGKGNAGYEGACAVHVELHKLDQGGEGG